MDPDRLSPVALRVAAVLGLLGVILGALGAHALKPALASFGTADVWSTAVLYQLVHAVALLSLAAAGRASAVVTWCWLAGILFFSGSLYVLAFTPFAWLGPLTPLGGLLLLIGWVGLAIRGR